MSLENKKSLRNNTGKQNLSFSSKSKNLLYDLSQTFELNISMVKETNKKSKDIETIIDHIKHIVKKKKSLLAEIKARKGKILIENQVQEELKRKTEENNDYYTDQIHSFENSNLSKDEYISILLQKLKQVEYFVKLKSKEKTSGFFKHRNFKMGIFLKENTGLYSRKLNLFKQIEEIENNIDNIKQENLLYQDEASTSKGDNDNSNISNQEKKIKQYIDVFRKSCQIMTMKIKLLKNCLCNFSKTIKYLNVPNCKL